MQAIFLYNPDVVQFDYGQSHPFRLERLWLTEWLCRAYGLFGGPEVEVRSFAPATREELLTAHESSYLDILESASDGIAAPGMALHGLSSGDNPVFPGLWDYARATAGGTLEGVRCLARGDARRVFHPGGGLHHAMPAQASGFCYVNDVVVAIRELLEQGRRVFYFDVDAHHGNGVEHAFYPSPEVLTFSIHQDGRTLFPGSGFSHEIGTGAGTGYTVNVPLMPGTTDGAYLRIWDELVAPLLDRFGADVIVTELGADALQGDPLAALALRLRGWWSLLQRLQATALPWLAVGGGGYNLANAMRAWTLAWGAMVGWEPVERIPDRPAELPGVAARMRWPTNLWDPVGPVPRCSPGDEATVGIIRQVRQQIFPHHGLAA